MSDPSDSRELIEAALKPWGWTCGPEFWDRYVTDPWVFNLVNALTRVTAEVERRYTKQEVGDAQASEAELVSRPLRNEIKRLETMLVDANEAFDECTGDHAKYVVKDEEWRSFRVLNTPATM